MMDGEASMMPHMMWGMGLLWLLLVVVLVLAAAVLVKCLFFEGRRECDG